MTQDQENKLVAALDNLNATLTRLADVAEEYMKPGIELENHSIETNSEKTEWIVNMKIPFIMEKK